jgi:hypothetical protein
MDTHLASFKCKNQLQIVHARQLTDLRVLAIVVERNDGVDSLQ